MKLKYGLIPPFNNPYSIIPFFHHSLLPFSAPIFYGSPNSGEI